MPNFFGREEQIEKLNALGLNPATGKPVREIRYRLRDNYTRFYLRYILPRRETVLNGF